MEVDGDPTLDIQKVSAEWVQAKMRIGPLSFIPTRVMCLSGCSLPYVGLVATVLNSWRPCLLPAPASHVRLRHRFATLNASSIYLASPSPPWCIGRALSLLQSPSLPYPVHLPPLSACQAEGRGCTEEPIQNRGEGG